MSNERKLRKDVQERCTIENGEAKKNMCNLKEE